MNNAIGSAIGVFTSIIVVAIIAVLVSKQSDTANIIGETGKSLGGLLTVAVSPITSGQRTFGTART